MGSLGILYTAEPCNVEFLFPHEDDEVWKMIRRCGCGRTLGHPTNVFAAARLQRLIA